VKQTVLVLALLSTAAFAQDKAKAPEPPKTPPAATAPAAPKPDTVSPKETVDSLKLQLALERQKAVQQQAQDLQTQAMQSIEPKMQPLRNEFMEQSKVAADEMEKVRKENNFGPDVNLDQNLNSPTFGKWVKTEKK
jgi:hypothetical protein